MSVKISYHCRGQLNSLAQRIADWRKRQGFTTTWPEVPAKLMLTVTELAEAMEAFRHVSSRYIEALELGRLYNTGPVVAATAPGTLLPERDDLYPINDPEAEKWLANFKEELADTLIRVLDMTESYGIDIEDEIDKKMQVNEQRPYKHNKEC